MNACMNNKQRQHGATMVELMIALLIGMFLLGGVLQIFSSNKSTFRSMDGIAEIQDNARAGIERMKFQVRQTGFVGCSNMRRTDFASNLNNKTAGTGAITFDETVLVAGTDNTGNNLSDTFTVFSTAVADTSVATNMTANNSNIRLEQNPLNFSTDDVLVITDCNNTDMFVATDVFVAGNGDTVIRHQRNNAAGNQVNNNGRLAKAYNAADSMMMRIRNLTYSIQTFRNDDAGNPVWSLAESVNGGANAEIMSGVEDMQVTFGEDTDNDAEPEFYRTATQLNASANWGNVVSIRIDLLVSTGRPIGPENRPYVDLAGNSVAAASSDRRMRRTFTTTVGLRNRTL